MLNHATHHILDIGYQTKVVCSHQMLGCLELNVKVVCSHQMLGCLELNVVWQYTGGLINLIITVSGHLQSTL